MKKRTKILLIFAVCLLIVIPVFYVAVYFHQANVKLEKIISKCPDIDLKRYDFPGDIGFYDCYNNIAIDIERTEDSAIYSLQDIKHEYSIISFETSHQYQLVGDIIYVFNATGGVGYYFIDQNGKQYYFDDYLVDGQMQSFDYNTIDEIPRYFAIDTITGNVRLYNNISDVPIQEGAIFQELERNYQENHI